MLARIILVLFQGLGSPGTAAGIGRLFGGETGSNVAPPYGIESEYPKANETARGVYRREWRDYYDCLENRAREAAAEKTIRPTVLSVLAGTCAVLRCELCVSPGESRETGRLEWRYNGTAAEGNDTVALPIEALSERVRVAPDARSLRVCNIEETEGGIYWCELGDTVSAPYHLEIDAGTESARSVKPEGSAAAAAAAEPRDRPAPPEILEEYGLRVFTRWTPWSLCSTCGRVGRRTRYGYCTISLIEDSLDEGGRLGELSGPIGPESSPSTIEKRDEDHRQVRGRSRRIVSVGRSRRSRSSDVSLSKEEGGGGGGESTSETTGTEALDEYGSDERVLGVRSGRDSREQLLARRLLPIFRNGLPCLSSKTPKEFRLIERIARRKTEIMTGLCKIECDERVIFEIRDNRGNLLESANNSAGIFSMVQGPPRVPGASVERVTIYRKRGSAVTLACPGNFDADVPVVWRVGTRELLPSRLREETAGRVGLDSRQRIIIERALFADSMIYGCWRRGRLAGTIRLRVTDRPESFELDRRLFFIGALAILSVLLRVFWRAYAARGRYLALRGADPPPLARG